MKVLLLRANSLRHKYLATMLAEYGFLAGEIVEQKKSANLHPSGSLVNLHFLARDQAEMDFFGSISTTDASIPRCMAGPGELGSPQVRNRLSSRLGG